MVLLVCEVHVTYMLDLGMYMIPKLRLHSCDTHVLYVMNVAIL